MVFTFSGEYGSGAKMIAEKLAEKTGYKYCDDQIITEAMAAAGADTKGCSFKFYDESMGESSVKEIAKNSAIQSRFFKMVADKPIEQEEFIKSNDPKIKAALLKLDVKSDILPLDKRMAASMDVAQNAIADQGNCILNGRCANYYLRGRDNVVSIFFIASDKDKAEFIQNYFNCTEAEAVKRIKSTNKRRAEFYNYFTSEKWDDTANYDMKINVSTLGIEGTAELLAAMAQIKDKK